VPFYRVVSCHGSRSTSNFFPLDFLPYGAFESSNFGPFFICSTALPMPLANTLEKLIEFYFIK
jgi:hypothetical protein